jgi:hypothetical protein
MRLDFLICGLSVWKARITESDPVGNSQQISAHESDRSAGHICFFNIVDDGDELIQRREGSERR